MPESQFSVAGPDPSSSVALFDMKAKDLSGHAARMFRMARLLVDMGELVSLMVLELLMLVFVLALVVTLVLDLEVQDLLVLVVRVRVQALARMLVLVTCWRTCWRW